MRIRSSPPSSWALARAACLDMMPRLSSLPSFETTLTRNSDCLISLFIGGAISGCLRGWRRPPPLRIAAREVVVGNMSAWLGDGIAVVIEEGGTNAFVVVVEVANINAAAATTLVLVGAMVIDNNKVCKADSTPPCWRSHTIISEPPV